MAVNFLSETLLTLRDAAKEVPGRPNLSTLHRWRLKGIRGIKLETCLIGGRRYTSREALDRFVAATTAAAEGECPPIRTPRQRQRAIENAERQVFGKTTADNSDVDSAPPIRDAR